MAARHNPESVKILLEHGADITIQNNNGQTAYDVARKDIKPLFWRLDVSKLSLQQSQLLKQLIAIL